MWRLDERKFHHAIRIEYGRYTLDTQHYRVWPVTCPCKGQSHHHSLVDEGASVGRAASLPIIREAEIKA
jgi:hypothetical protein